MKLSGHQIKQFVCMVFCFFFAAAAAASAESMPASAADLQPESVSGAETHAIEDDFWLNGDYMLMALPDDSSGEIWVNIYLDDPQTGDHVQWIFSCDAGSEPDNLLSRTFTETDSTYDEDNLLVQKIYPDQACEARFILNEKDQVTVSGTSDARLDGMVSAGWTSPGSKAVSSSHWMRDRNGGWRSCLL